MRRKPEIAVCVAVAAVVFASCGLRRGSGDSVKTFPAVSIPSVCSSPESRMEYALMHYWDGFEGVPADGIEKAMATYAAMLDEAPYGLAERSLVRLFDRICEAQAADTSAHYYALMTQMVSKYLYDPNSPLRNEELYLPFVSRMASSPLTPEEMIPAYEYEASSCAICRIGTKAPDFVARTMEGREFRMHSLTSDYVVGFVHAGENAVAFQRVDHGFRHFGDVFQSFDREDVVFVAGFHEVYRGVFADAGQRRERQADLPCFRQEFGSVRLFEIDRQELESAGVILIDEKKRVGKVFVFLRGVFAELVDRVHRLADVPCAAHDDLGIEPVGCGGE